MKTFIDTSEAEQDVVSSVGDIGADTPSDTIYQGINFSALRRELSIQKLWRGRTWNEILRHFFVALIFGAFGSFIDISTDGLSAKSFIRGANYTKWVKNLSDPANHNDCVHTGRFTSFNPGPEIEYEEIVCFEEDPIWGWVTVLFMFFPAFLSADEVARIVMDVQGKRSYPRHLLLVLCLAFPCLIMFPLVFISVKVVCLINPGPQWKRLNVRITGLEGSWESAFQTVLTLFIIFTRADRQPSNVQIASVVASIAMVTKTSIADYLSPKQPLNLTEELKAAATLLPLFLSNAMFKVLSLAITFTCLRYIAFAVVSLVVFGALWLHAVQKKASCCPKRFILLIHGDHRITSLRLEADRKATNRQNTESCVCHDIIWGISYLIVLTSLVGAANIHPDSLNYTVTDLGFLNYLDINISSVQSSHISKRPGLVDNLPLLNASFGGILLTMALNASLFYLQIWKPMVQEEEAEQRESEENVLTGSEEGK